MLAVATALLLPPVLTLLFTRVLLPVALAPRGGPAALDAVVAVLLLCAYAAPIVVAAGRLRWGWLLSLAFALLFVGLVRVPGFHCLFVDSSQFLAGLLLVLLWPAGAIGALAGAAWGATSRRQAAAEAAMASPPPIGPPAPRP
ncbi:MAG TPA: hypothetical protein VFH47_00505 [Candidatus Thermoplasmatota archaeon]|nr:hypothetical protein [Candidatus Thermoplasmatota archaeon]